MALLVLLESLSPVERAVFLLHDVFDYGYDEIAEIVGKSRENCRQLALRARRHVDAGRPRFDPSAEERAALVARFFEAIGDGDVDGLVSMLAEDATIYGDGGGKAAARATPLTGAEKIARFMVGLTRIAERDAATARAGGRERPAGHDRPRARRRGDRRDVGRRRGRRDHRDPQRREPRQAPTPMTGRRTAPGTRRRRPAPPRCAAAGCTWRPGPSATARRS